MRTTRSTAAVAGLLVLTSCAPLGIGERGRGVTMENGGIVITGDDLNDGRGDLLNAMMGKVPNFRVRQLKEACPQITLRNAVSYQSVVNPLVYVDGTRSVDTCILETLRTVDVTRVEVYPAGFTTRPGYGMHAHGLILVFMRGATESRAQGGAD
jgi:hypothetical protein